MKVTTSAKQAASSMAKITTLKGESYAAEVHQVMEQIAAGLGDEYADTGAILGAVPRSKKGDGVLTISGGSARIVLEMTTSKRPNWTGYLDEAERNRSAAASLGLVRAPAEQWQYRPRSRAAPDRHGLRSRHRRPGAAAHSQRLSALTAADSKDRDGIHTADARIAEALGMLGKIDDIMKVAGSLRQNAGKIEQQSDDVRTALTHFLSQAQEALSVAAEAAHDAA